MDPESAMSPNSRLDQRLVSLIGFSVIALGVVVPFFIGYVLAGMTAMRFGLDPFPYAFLTLDGDLVFAVFGTLSGIFICIGSLSHLFRVILMGRDDRAIAISILLSMIVLGFGLAILRFSIWPLLDKLRQVLHPLLFSILLGTK